MLQYHQCHILSGVYVLVPSMSHFNRLWGDHGQSALENARVCLINVTATGTEILKNLILPGIGSFTIVDGNKVTGEDVVFFLTKDSIGESRAKVASELLSELNEDVSADYVEEHVENMVQSNPDFFRSFSLVIATNICERTLLQLGENLWNMNIPLLICRCYGFIGYMRLAVKEHTVIESHPDSVLEDLRLDRPFTALVEYCDSLDLETMSKKDHSHTPWLVIIYKYLQEWKKTHNGEGPKNYREKTQFKELVKQGIRKNESGGLEEEENFDEAVNHVNTALLPTSVPSEVKKLFEDPSCTELNVESKRFWIMLRAVKEFVVNEGNGALPLRGTIPDMTSDSKRYIELQQTYRDQASQDVTIVTEKLQTLLQSIGRGELVSVSNPPMIFIALFFTGSYCIVMKNIIFRFTRPEELERQVVRGSFQKDAIMLFKKSFNIHCKNSAFVRLEDEDSDNETVFYVLLRTVDKFYEDYNRYPGWYNDQVESDITKLKSCMSKILQDWGISANIKDDYVHEICRYGAAELHTVASFIGGAAAQEAIKVITSQFVPFNNTYIYNAMKQTSVTIEL
ncbi:hypothetical protein KUTeg_019889 [Tegillarca granosa]|uniref:NEDD8-activating enzyme E1 regulatory subunit n=1 Tax=Tegillarca granosa TaxID=220873 RepID=A0ABQ9EJT1_TEGGR|nr:hypothetical protein KUTeg_019889 [Tegillarca granosa]